VETLKSAAFATFALLVTLLPLKAVEQIEFAVPDPGLITLGVFDDSGHLVRMLHRLAKQEDFRIGLNGLVTSWDGADDAGKKVPAGHYDVRGYLVGTDVAVSGEDFLFNDWATDSGFPNFNNIQDLALLENGDVLLLCGDRFSLDGQLVRFSPDKGFLWVAPINQALRSRFPSSRSHGCFRQSDTAGHLLGGSVIRLLPPTPPLCFSPLLASNSSSAFVLSNAGTGVFSLEDGKETFFVPCNSCVPPLAVAADDSQLFISSKGALLATSLPSLDHETVLEAPVENGSVKNQLLPPSALSADSSVLAAVIGGGVWLREKSFSKVALPTPVRDVALGTPGTFWFVGEEDHARFVAQASFAGEMLRLLRPADGDPQPEKIRASRTTEKFAVLEALPGLQRVRVMERTGAGEWEIEWERTLRDASTFGFVDGIPSANADKAPADPSVRVRLNENPLTGSRDFLTVHAAFDALGSTLASPDGLPLVDVSSRRDIVRLAIRAGDKPGTIRLLQGNGSFVEEFLISGLGDIVPLNAGSIDIP